MVLSETVGVAATGDDESDIHLGSRGVTVSELFPGGYVMIDDQRFEAKSKHGKIHRDVNIRVVEKNGLELIVEAME